MPRGHAARRGDELLGLLLVEGTSAVDLARAVASQTAVAIKKIELIERLTEKNLIKDFFEQLAGGSPFRDVEGTGRAARLRSRRALRRAGGRSAHGRLEKAVLAAAPRLALRPAGRFDPGARAHSADRRGALAGRPAADPAPARHGADDRRVERLQRRRQLPRRLRGGAARAPRLDRAAQASPG